MPSENNCGVSTSIWDALEKSGTPKSEVVSVLCRAVGIDPPRRENDDRKMAIPLKQLLQPGPGKQFSKSRNYLLETIVKQYLNYSETETLLMSRYLL